MRKRSETETDPGHNIEIHRKVVFLVITNLQLLLIQLLVEREKVKNPHLTDKRKTYIHNDMYIICFSMLWVIKGQRRDCRMSTFGGV